MVLSAADTVVPVEPENVPDVLKQAERWCCWRRELTDKGTFTKKPMQASWPGRGFSKTTASQYRSFATAVKTYELHRNNERTPIDGIGFVTGGGFVALDWDECVDEVTREIHPEVESQLRRLNTYAEFSPSGRGVRAFVKGKLPGESVVAKDDVGIELYDEPNYVTVTGFAVPGFPSEVAEGGEALLELYEMANAKKEAARERREAEKKARKASTARQAATISPEKPEQGDEIPPAGRSLSDEEVLSLARNSQTNAAQLLDGSVSGYPSQSEAEYALANHLAFYAGPGGEAQVERLIRGSGMNRDKLNNSLGGDRTYLSHTVAKAFDGRTDFYSPRTSTARRREAEVLSLPNGMAGTGPASLTDTSTLTDVGLARRLVLESRGKLRYVKEWKAWLAWSGRQWMRDDGLAAAHVAKQVSDKLWQELAELPSENRQRVVSFVKAASSSRGIEAAVKLARSEPGVVVTAGELDRHPYLLNVQNGVLNLETAELLPSSPEHLLTHMAGVSFDVAANCPTWRKFIDEVTNGDKELAGFLQRSCGLALSADVSEQVLWLHHGEGRNGKSTMLNVLSLLLGSYAGPAPLEMLLVRGKQAKEAEQQFATLAGKRLVTTVEADSGVRFSEATTKLLTGGDIVLARRLYEDPWPVQPSWKLHVAANHKPLVRGRDEGIWRRLMLTPWLRRFEGAAEDKRLKEKILAELPGVLNWCLGGFVQWRSGGLRPPKQVLAATAEYRDENDVMGSWMAECCLKDANVVAEAQQLYNSYRNWCENTGERVDSAKAFGTQLEKLGFAAERPSFGRWRNRTIRRGLGLLDAKHEEPA